MRTLGIIALLIGLLGLFGTLSMDTSVGTDDPLRRVHNIGLMNQKQNMLLVFSVISVIGAVFVAFGGRKNKPEPAAPEPPRREWLSGADPEEKKCPFCAEMVKYEAKICRFCRSELPEPESRTAAAAKAAPPAVDPGPLGVCPSCKAHIPLSSEDCPKCNASFGVGSAWKVRPL